MKVKFEVIESPKDSYSEVVNLESKYLEFNRLPNKGESLLLYVSGYRYACIVDDVCTKVVVDNSGDACESYKLLLSVIDVDTW